MLKLYDGTVQPIPWPHRPTTMDRRALQAVYDAGVAYGRKQMTRAPGRRPREGEKG